jgi:hypothetical protein
MNEKIKERKSAIWLPVSLIERLKKEGSYGETYADIIRRLLERRGRKPKEDKDE